MSERSAMEEIEKGGGTQFDPVVVEAFMRCVQRRLVASR